MVRIWVYQHDVCFLEKQADCCGAGDCNCRGDARVLFAMQYDGGPVTCENHGTMAIKKGIYQEMIPTTIWLFNIAMENHHFNR